MTDKHVDGKTKSGLYSNPDPILDDALEWFLRLQEDHSAEALDEFTHWVSSDRARQQAFDGVLHMQAMPSLQKATLADQARRHTALRGGVKKQLRKPRFTAKGLSAFAMAAIIAGGIAWQQIPEMLVRFNADHVTSVGARETFELPDGSHVTLNTASAIAIDFSDNQRHVKLLKGEAYFDVEHDPNLPFVVTAHFADVTVKGTAFSVFSDDQQDTVTLERGRVEVTRTIGREEKTVLEPGHIVTASSSGLSTVSAIDVSQSLSWREGSVIFRDRSFNNALSDLERYFDGKVYVVTSRFSNMLVNGNYRVAEAEAAIRTLAVSVGANVTRLPGDILILR